VQGLVIAGTRSGRLGEVLSEFAEYDEAGAELRRRLWLSLSYPIILMVTAGLLFIILSKYVVQGFASIFADFGVDLPAMTVGLIKMSNSFNKAGPWLAIGPLLVIVLFFLVERLALGPAQRRRLAFELPLFGKLWKWSALAEFSHLLGVLLEGELPLVDSLKMASAGTHDAALVEASRRMAVDIQNGEALGTAVSRRPEFPFGYAHILQWAEAHQSLPDALHMAGEIYHARAQTQATFVGVICSIVTVIFVILGVTSVYIALFFPLIQLISKLSG
jgi:general secretion pathway protein F